MLWTKNEIVRGHIHNNKMTELNTQIQKLPHLDCQKAGLQPLGIDSCLQGILSVSCLHEHTQIAVQYEDTYKAVCGHI